MATQTEVTSPEISAEMVGCAFVSQFYQILHSSPEFVYRFYNDQSTMKRPGPTGSLVTATAMDGIKDLILSLDCTNYKAEILTADTQASYKNGVTVLVTGFLTGQDNLKRKFSESFFLAPQDSGFFVLNNIFRFIDQESLPVENPVEVQSEKIAPTAPVSEPEKIIPAAPVSTVALVQETTEVSDNSLGNHTAVVKETVETITEPVAQERSISIEKVVPQPSSDPSPNVQPAAESLSNGGVGAPKVSYASLLMNGKHNSSALPTHVPARPVKRNVAPKSVPSPVQKTQAAAVPAAAAPAAASESSEANGNASVNGHTGSNGHVAAKGHSIYVGHLPYDATPELVEREFKKFGRIKKNGIQVRSNKGYVFGFIEYEDASAQEKALQTGIIQIGDREVNIEEKKTVARADDYPSGRGGYRNDGFRRGNYSNGRGYVRNDYGRRNGEGPRGRGNGDGFVSQNGGGRGSRQGAAPK
ncbi:hypothetical protein vseg_001753 [Gypsophila vaccaria]